jgi:hypothetical protein
MFLGLPDPDLLGGMDPDPFYLAKILFKPRFHCLVTSFGLVFEK